MEKLEETLQQINVKLQKTVDKLGYPVNDMATAKQENKELREGVHKQEQKIQFIERELKKNNLVVKGIADDKNENNGNTEEKIVTVFQKIGVEIDKKADIDEVRRIGRYTEGRKRPILIKVTRGNKKTEIQKMAKKFKGPDIWIDEDYPKEIQEERKALIPELIEPRKKGNRAFLRYNKLIINEDIYEVKDLETNNQKEARMEIGEKARSSQKRSISERSPEGNIFAEQLRKITKTQAKNG